MVRFAVEPSLPPGTEAVGVPVGADLDVAAGLSRLFAGSVDGGDLGSLDAAGARRFLEVTGFTGRAGETAALPVGDRLLIAVGVAPVVTGAPGSAGPSADDLRRAGAALGRAARVKTLATTIHHAGHDAGVDPLAAAQAVVEGLALSTYRYRDPYRSGESGGPGIQLAAAVLVDDRPAQLRPAIAVGEVGAWATMLARRWVDRPAAELTPPVFAAEAAEGASQAGLEVEVWDEARIGAEGLGCLAGVAAGSSQPPRLVHVSYDPPGRNGHVALVGKGITFDSGGLSLKPPKSMELMKKDMGGAAAVLSAVLACPLLDVPVRVDAWAAIAENLPSGTATRPGDVLKARDGTTVEVVNTDAEGRLVLADALILARETAPDVIVDVATLTGGQRAALGAGVAAVCGTDDAVWAVTGAAASAGEPAWRLPLWDPYRSRLDSEVADLRNVAGDGDASTITAALFLQRFVGDRPWAHLDIAGPSWADRTEGWLTKGATGWGTRTLLQLVRTWPAGARPS